MNYDLSIEPGEPLVTGQADDTVSVHGSQYIALPDGKMIMAGASLRITREQAESLVGKLNAWLAQGGTAIR